MIILGVRYVTLHGAACCEQKVSLARDRRSGNSSAFPFGLDRIESDGAEDVTPETRRTRGYKMASDEVPSSSSSFLNHHPPFSSFTESLSETCPLL